MMVYVAIASFLFSREYTESTLKTILPIPVSRTKLLFGKFCSLLLWIVTLNIVTWAGIYVVCGIYHAVFTLKEYSLLVAIEWFPRFLLGGILMFLTTSPFVFAAGITKGFVAPMIGSAVIYRHGQCSSRKSRMGCIISVDSHIFSCAGQN